MRVAPLLVLLWPGLALAERWLELGLQQQWWREEQGRFVAEDGQLPLLGAGWRGAEVLAGWEGAASVWLGEVGYRGINQANTATVFSHSRYHGGSVGLARWWPAGRGWQTGVGTELLRWRRDIANPLLRRDQAEVYRTALLQAGVRLAMGPALELALGVDYPAWTRVDVALGEFGFERSPQLRPRGQWSPRLALVSWLEPGFRLQLGWSRLRFAASPAQQVGSVSVWQPDSELERVHFSVARLF